MWFYTLMIGEAQQLDSRDKMHGLEILNPDAEVIICDNEAQTADLIRWEIVENNIRAELVDYSREANLVSVEYLNTKKAVIFSGSRQSVNDEGATQIPLGLKVPHFGICYGGQAIAKAYGGEVGRVTVDGHDKSESSITEIDIVDPNAVIYDRAESATVRMSHYDSITQIPPGFHTTAMSGNIVASFESDDGRIIGTQFHPEVRDTLDGRNMLLRYLTQTAGIVPDPSYTLEVALNEMMEREEARVHAILENGDEIRGFLSGGVDSMAAARLIVTVATRLGRMNQVKFYYVDNGHMRIEDENVIDTMIAQGMPVEKIDAAEEFFHRKVMVPDKKTGELFLAPPLVEAADPALKRDIIGIIFKHISRRIIDEAQALTDKRIYFMQGTNASDIVESREVKGHHNVEAMEEDRQAGTLIEPLRHLLKYHIRLLAEKRYGLPGSFAYKQPFPGPGLSPRIIVNEKGSFEPADPKLQERLDNMISYHVGHSIMGHIVNMKSVGVKGDSRSVANAVFLNSTGQENWKHLEKLSRLIPDEITLVNRVFYVKNTPIDRSAIRGTRVVDDEVFTAQLRRMEEIHRQAMLDANLDEYLSQHFVGTLPVDLNGSGLPLLGLRLFITGEQLDTMAIRRRGHNKETFRTGVAAIPGKQITRHGFIKLFHTLSMNLVDHQAVAYDLTDKPPGSTEWE